jgi:hypothetical protein
MGISRLVDMLDDKRDIIRNGQCLYVSREKRKGTNHFLNRGLIIIDWINS